MRRAPAAAAAARPEQPALHIKRTNEGRGGEMKKGVKLGYADTSPTYL